MTEIFNVANSSLVPYILHRNSLKILWDVLKFRIQIIFRMDFEEDYVKLTPVYCATASVCVAVNFPPCKFYFSLISKPLPPQNTKTK